MKVREKVLQYGMAKSKLSPQVKSSIFVALLSKAQRVAKIGQFFCIEGPSWQ
ncbi:hypothetical protein [Parasphingorhabdus halotolerans]|uniref:hypothetical protein n=1 Tax=Parasphingorhabdus halotolerans TaxID=2725558 RepID=UPI001B3A484F|nr:hypothetical protein [Parasphingorhabdus halotolerans]